MNAVDRPKPIVTWLRGVALAAGLPTLAGAQPFTGWLDLQGYPPTAMSIR